MAGRLRLPSGTGLGCPSGQMGAAGLSTPTLLPEAFLAVEELGLLGAFPLVLGVMTLKVIPQSCVGHVRASPSPQGLPQHLALEGRCPRCGLWSNGLPTYLLGQSLWNPVLPPWGGIFREPLVT